MFTVADSDTAESPKMCEAPTGGTSTPGMYLKLLATALIKSIIILAFIHSDRSGLCDQTTGENDHPFD